jgi:protein TonB
MLLALLLNLALFQSPAAEGNSSGSVVPVKGPQRVKSVAAVYPEEARRAGLSGDVVLECEIDAQGKVNSLKLLSGVSPLYEAAIDAVMEWEFEPAILRGQPISSATTVTVRYGAQPFHFEDLMSSLSSRNEHIREVAARNLGGLRPGTDVQPEQVETAVRSLDALATTDECESVRSAARRAAARLGGRPEPPPMPVEPSSLSLSGETAPAPPSPARNTRFDTRLLDYDQSPKPIRSPKPTYPFAAFKARIEGTVLVEILIDSQGRVARSRVIQSVPGLDDSALATVRQWLFQPALKNGKPVATLAHVPVSYRIGDKKK